MTFGSEGLTISSETDDGNSGLFKLAEYLVAVDYTYDRSHAALENAFVPSKLRGEECETQACADSSHRSSEPDRCLRRFWSPFAGPR